MAYIENLDAQQLFGLIKLKFGESNISLKTIKSTTEQGLNQKWAQKGEIRATYKDNDFKIIFNTDLEFSSISFNNGINEAYYEEFITLMNAIMGQGASLRYSNGAVIEWINDIQLAQKRYEKLSPMLKVEVLREDLKSQLLACKIAKNFQSPGQQIKCEKSYLETVKQS